MSVPCTPHRLSDRTIQRENAVDKLHELTTADYGVWRKVRAVRHSRLTNEWYAKDTSPKIRAVKKAKGDRGERLTANVPYGYKRDSGDLKKWVIDEEAAQVVKRIFALCMEGKGPSQIAALLEKEKVLNPTAYKQREGRKTPHQTPENEYRWHESTVAYILEYMEYTGCTVNFKTYTNSIWDKKQRENPMENRKIFYNTHPAIISFEVFDKVQEIRQQRHRRTAMGKSNMFSGLVFCNDCKQKLYYSTTSYFEKRQDFFICSTHRANKDKCSGHYIRAIVLEQIVWKHIQEVLSAVTRYEAYFRSEMEQKLRMQSEESLRLHQKRLTQAEKRIGELDRLFIRIYEDNVAGRLDDERFAMMSKNYTEEQKGLKAEVKGLQQQIHEQEQGALALSFPLGGIALRSVYFCPPLAGKNTRSSRQGFLPARGTRHP